MWVAIPAYSNQSSFRTGPAAGLNLKQRRFAEYYVIFGNKTQAALKAGYSANSASWIGSHLSDNDKIKAYVKHLLDDQDSDIMLSIEEAKRRMSLAVRGKLTEQVVVTVKKRKTITIDGKRTTETVEEPALFEKPISMRDQIEAGKLYLTIRSTAKEEQPVESASTIDDVILKSLASRTVSSTLSEDIPPAQEENHADGQE